MLSQQIPRLEWNFATEQYSEANEYTPFLRTGLLHCIIQHISFTIIPILPTHLRLLLQVMSSFRGFQIQFMYFTENNSP
jgi:hypothetical protein